METVREQRFRMKIEGLNDCGNDGLLRIRAAAAMLGVSQRTVWRMIADGQLKPVHVRGCTCLVAAHIRRVFQDDNAVGCL